MLFCQIPFFKEDQYTITRSFELYTSEFIPESLPPLGGNRGLLPIYGNDKKEVTFPQVRLWNI